MLLSYYVPNFSHVEIVYATRTTKKDYSAEVVRPPEQSYTSLVLGVTRTSRFHCRVKHIAYHARHIIK